ncbi:MAG: AarF/ABC1/UbiB kinase family protein [Chloracidobacterium sp.]|uniref:AarF/ABC1/UbiB kinase family protein n=1 Tax=Chloracidobacterium validum TaxID=2821543 RepID=A0ABX8B7S5_9BACT|nr:AarF/ABC1/UbiB kinase family protein [Chloracidobacterium validum]QUW02716.1 AarF/ABC1/UbiB kinase family protein [Chloracidobacterium validum]
MPTSPRPNATTLRRRFVTILKTFWPFCRAWLASCLPTGDRAARTQRAAERLREALERLGIVFIKVGQVVGVRTDTLSPPYAAELAKLQDAVRPVPIHIVKPFLEREYGRVLSELFEWFDPEPLATASLGQVHRARWRGRDVVIKFLKPDTLALLETDFELIRRIANGLRRISRNPLWEDILTVVGRFEAGFREEADFASERQHAVRIREMLADFPGVVVPETVDELCTPRVLVLDFIAGCRISDADAVCRIVRKPQRLLDRLVHLYAYMMLCEGYYHADPHPGNFLVLPDGRLALLDFGMVQTMSASTRKALADMVRAATQGRLDEVVDGFYRIGLVSPDTPRAQARAAIAQIGEINILQSNTKNRIAAVGQAVERSQVRFLLPEDLAYAFRLIQMLEGVASYYQPGWNVIADGSAGLQAALEDLVRRTAAQPVARVPSSPPVNGTRPVGSPVRRLFQTLQETLGPVADRLDQAAAIQREPVGDIDRR